MIDLRSDTVTLPSKEMMEAIQQAQLGDDVYGEDETVNKLEELAAKKLGKEAGLLVCSGTQGNLVSVMSHLQRGEGIVLESESHIYFYEVAGFSVIAGAYPFLIEGNQGVYKYDKLEAVLTRPKNIHYPQAKLVCIENTHNRAGGKVIDKTDMDKIADLAHDNGANVHVDGARIFNASVALKMSPAKLVEKADSIQFCLSKGLACPIGSMVVGTADFIQKARKNRKMVGGGMRQAGIIAAPGIYALNNMIERLEEDHKHAKMIEQTFANIEQVRVKPVESNIVIADMEKRNYTADIMYEKFKKEGVLVTKMGPTLIRFVPHFGISTEEIKVTCKIIEKLF